MVELYSMGGGGGGGAMATVSIICFKQKIYFPQCGINSEKK